LERRAYQAIAYEEERARVFDSAKSARVQHQRFEMWEKAVEATQQAIQVYDAHQYLLSCLQGKRILISCFSSGLEGIKQLFKIIVVPCRTQSFKINTFL
jgi:hypothetical protein